MGLGGKSRQRRWSRSRDEEVRDQNHGHVALDDRGGAVDWTGWRLEIPSLPTEIDTNLLCFTHSPLDLLHILALFHPHGEIYLGIDTHSTGRTIPLRPILTV